MRISRLLVKTRNNNLKIIRVSQMNIQKMSKNKEVQVDYKLRAFIIFLFVVIVCVLKFAHVYYDRHVLQVSKNLHKPPD